MSQRRRVVIDCDPGIDDALALWLAAASPELEILGVCCVAGNRPVELTARNACKVLDAAGRGSVPVHVGCARPIAHVLPRSNTVHGDDGLGGVPLPTARKPNALHALDFLSQTLLDAPPGTLTLIALGPLTNLALAEIRHPGLLRRARDVLVMGGAAFRRGNATPHAEFNFHADATAAHVVLGCEATVTLFTLDVTEQAAMSPAWMASLDASSSTCSRMAHAMLGAYAAQEASLHDPCPVAYAIDSLLFECEPWITDVDWHAGTTEGRLHAVRPPKGRACNTRLAVTVDSARLLPLVRERLGRLP